MTLITTPTGRWDEDFIQVDNHSADVYYGKQYTSQFKREKPSKANCDLMIIPGGRLVMSSTAFEDTTWLPHAA